MPGRDLSKLESVIEVFADEEVIESPRLTAKLEACLWAFHHLYPNEPIDLLRFVVSGNVHQIDATKPTQLHRSLQVIGGPFLTWEYARRSVLSPYFELPERVRGFSIKDDSVHLQLGECQIEQNSQAILPGRFDIYKDCMSKPIPLKETHVKRRGNGIYLLRSYKHDDGQLERIEIEGFPL
ncbi:hypothetical protein XM38_031000 [Halomicronema hongdechloris C2206]|uniref:pPIWI-RE three-gene island domain-containing protein n=1 Tax=Halomicronema hongdechloris C2206 TaxID=1641165 RepID=A0A1V8NJN5_9CYAN|nr:hypothetical protein [Halomicronema hongdechloris]ASC72146.1 hypothetical protein XM38_031000 [Halomicronema hongdechloris C2206]